MTIFTLLLCLYTAEAASTARSAIRPAPDPILRESEALVARSVVRIERQTTYAGGGRTQRMINHGTGVIIGEQQVHGHREYLLLSNEHVARNYHVNGDSTLFIVAGDGVRAPIPLEAVATDERRDQALLRTVGCEQRFVVPDFVIGPPPEGSERDSAFTEGYGGGEFRTLRCGIVSTKARSWGLRCYRIDVAVGGGQSGAPLVVIGADQRLYLPALVFSGNDQFTAATPLHPGKGVLQHLPEMLRGE